MDLHVEESNFINITDDNAEIQEKIPQAECEVVMVEEHPGDTDFRRFLFEFAQNILRSLLPHHFTVLGEISQVG